MKIILLFLAALASFTVHAQPPSQTVEQTVRHIYQNYKSDATAPYFGETGERAITSARIQQALTLNDNLTLPGNIGWLDYDPVCDCQDFGDLVLESVAITQTDADHADAIDGVGAAAGANGGRFLLLLVVHGCPCSFRLQKN